MGISTNGDGPGEDGRLVFCRQMHPRLVGALALYCGRLDVAEELAQEALARALARWERVEGMDRPAAWVHQVAYNLARSWFRRRAAERRAQSRHGPAPGVHHDPDPVAAVAVRDALGELSPRQRAAVVLRHCADLSIEETATVMGCAPGTVQALTARGVKALRARLGEHVSGVAAHKEDTDAR